MIYIFLIISLYTLGLLERKLYKDEHFNIVRLDRILKFIYILIFLNLLLISYFSAVTFKGVFFLFLYLSCFVVNALNNKYNRSDKLYILIDFLILFLIIISFILSSDYLLIKIRDINIIILFFILFIYDNNIKRDFKVKYFALVIVTIILIIIYINNKSIFEKRILTRQEILAKEYLENKLGYEVEVFDYGFFGGIKGQEIEVLGYSYMDDNNDRYKLIYKDDEIVSCTLIEKIED